MASLTLYDIMYSEYLVPALAGMTAFIIFFLSFLKNAAKRAKRRKYLRSPLSKIDHMKGEEFEQFLAAYFESLGYKVKTTAGSGDFGADLIIKKGGVRTVVQAKRYKNHVGVAAVQQAISAMAYYHAQHCMVATNSYFTAAAKKLARETGVELWDRTSLLNMKSR